MPGKTWERAFDLALDQHGYVTFTDARRLNFDPALLRQWNARGLVERAAHGVYRFVQAPRTELDEYRLATLWAAGRGVLSHETALQLHGLGDAEPALIHITVPTDYRPRRKGGEIYVIHHQDLQPRDVTKVEGIPIVTPVCAIVQALEAHARPHLVHQAIEVARRLGRAPTPVLDDLERRLMALPT